MSGPGMPAQGFEPIPPPSELTGPFWAGGLAGELRLQRCASCGHLRYPVSAICPRCLSGEASFEAVSGQGAVQTYIVFERAYHDTWKDQVPYIVALVELDEGPVFLTNIVGVPPAQVRVGQRVTAVFPCRSESAALPQFTPADSEAPR
jgi:uncharacterized OB-fold protein